MFAGRSTMFHCNQASSHLFAAMLAGWLILIAPGCGSNVPPEPPAPEPTAQERFDSIVSFLRRVLEDNSSGYTSFSGGTDGSTSLQMHSVHIEAPEEITKLDDPSEPYRASVKMILKTAYSFDEGDSEAATEEDESSTDLPEPTKSDNSSIGDVIIDTDSTIIDPNSGILHPEKKSSPSTKIRIPQVTSAHKTEEVEVVFHLKYINQRWVLANNVGDDAPRSFVDNMNVALERQF